MVYQKNLWEQENLVKKKPKPIKNAFSYNPRRVIKAVKFQTGVDKNLKRDLRVVALAPGKRISKNGKVYYEYRTNRSDLKGNLK